MGGARSPGSGAEIVSASSPHQTLCFSNSEVPLLQGSLILFHKGAESVGLGCSAWLADIGPGEGLLACSSPLCSLNNPL